MLAELSTVHLFDSCAHHLGKFAVLDADELGQAALHECEACKIEHDSHEVFPQGCRAAGN